MIHQISVLLRVAIVFAVILIAIRRKLSLGNAFLMGAVLLGILFELDTRQILHSIVAAVTDPKTLSLAVIVGLILILSNSMEKAGQMRRLLESFRGLIANPRLNLTIFPALIGLLPMPGGALFSAPMVKEMGGRSGLSDSQLSFVNYWFRHIWEYWWPMYPGVLLAVVLADMHLALFILLMAPLTVAAVCLGRQSLKRMAVSAQALERLKTPSARPFLKELVPILIVIVPGLGAGVPISAVFPTFTVAKQK
jgi:integral membrane protein (TIGR00529 family)